MNKKYFWYGLGIIFLITLIITNPSEEKHKLEMKNMILTSMKKEMANNLMDGGGNSFAGTLQGLGLLIGEKYVENFVDGIISRKNFFLFSLTQGEYKGNQKIAGVGILGNVYIFPQVKKYFEPKNTKEEKEEKRISQKDKNYNNPEEWLRDIFVCKNNSSTYCYYLEKEQDLCTDRFNDFLSDANEIYGPSSLTDDEYPIAKKKYEEKWSSIYPLNTQEMWLFGRGNDDNESIKNVEINKISDLKYSVYIDYGENIKTENEVTLVADADSYKIDYCKTKFVE